MANVSTSKVIDGNKVVVNTEYNFGESLAEAVSLFGEEVVFDYFTANATVRLQAFVRTRIEARKSEEEIQEEANGWKPGVVQRSSKDPKESIVKDFAKLSAAQRAELLASLQESLGV